MHVIQARNVNDAYTAGFKLLLELGERKSSRAGDVLVYPTPVTTVYLHPMERVLFDSIRDANPIFHLFESLWILAGRNDARWLDQFVKDFSSRFAEEDGIQHGAYGYRWRVGFGFDQLETVVGKLRANPDDRQCVIQMWDATQYGYAYGFDDLKGLWKDRPCNTHIYLRVREEVTDYGQLEHGLKYASVKGYTKVLDITVCCRSNDAIWGAYGANAVHFSVLQEYLAARIGVKVGKYYQISNNFHVYTDVLEKITFPDYTSDKVLYGRDVDYQPMITDPSRFDDDLRRFMVWTLSYQWDKPGPRQDYPGNPWFSTTAEPLFMAASLWRAKQRSLALLIVEALDSSMAPDWRLAVRSWMERRMVVVGVQETGMAEG